MTHIIIDETPLSLGDMAAVRGGAKVTLSEDCIARAAEGAESVRRILGSGRTVYGINTGFGLLAQTSIASDQLEALQRNLVLSHAAGVGDSLPASTVRLILLLKIKSLSAGLSGVRPAVLSMLGALLSADALPVIPAKGSVGASGDLAPLAHLAMPLIGEGMVTLKGEILPAAQALKTLNLEPLTLGPKEGLALLNGTQASTAIALEAFLALKSCFASALLIGAMSVDAMKGSDAPFDARIHAARGHRGQQDVAAALRQLLEGSAIRASHTRCSKVQDPYSLRCQPQVMGACLDHLRHIGSILQTEANAVTDNPLIFPEDDTSISGGNFHAAPVALAADLMAIIAADIASISERRTSLLVDPKLSGLPAFLTPNSGVNSGFMIAQVTAAALVSESKTLAHPASVDTIPTSAGQEDHVSMATWAARKAVEAVDNLGHVLAVELLAACQGLDFHDGLASSPAIEAARKAVRAKIPMLEDDREMAADMKQAKAIIDDNILVNLMPSTEDFLD